MTGRAGKLQHFRYGVAKVRGRWYYRYHKPIGKANWKGYQERYIKPKDVEAKQRLVFAPKATTAQLKQSLSWQWRLPKMLAAATTPNQVLDAWILFRYRQPKRLSHYFLALRRLVEVGGCSPSDWRLEALLGRMRKGYRRVINLDILLSHFARLKLYKEIELITRLIKPRLQSMTTGQQVTVLKSLGNCQLRDAAVAGKCVRYIRQHISDLSSNDLIDIVKSLGRMEIRDCKFVAHLLTNLLARPELTLIQFKHLLMGLSDLRFRDYTVIEFAVELSTKALDKRTISDYATICSIAHLIHNIGVYEEDFLVKIVDTIDPYGIPIDSVVKVLSICAGETLLKPKASEWLQVMRESVPLFHKHETIVSGIVAINGFEDKLLMSAMTKLFVASRSTAYNVSTIATAFVQNDIADEEVWAKVVKDIPRSAENFDPADLVQMAKLLLEVSSLTETQKSTTANILSEWSLKRWEEFTPSQWKQLREHTSALKCNDWCRTELNKWGNILAKTRKTHRKNSSSA